MAIHIALVRDSENVAWVTVFGEFSPDSVRVYRKNNEDLFDGVVIGEDESEAIDEDLRFALAALEAMLADEHFYLAFECLLSANLQREGELMHGVLVGEKDVGDDAPNVSRAHDALEALFKTHSMRRAYEYVLERVKVLGRPGSTFRYSGDAILVRG